MQEAKFTDLVCLGLIAFNLALALHYAVTNWIFTLLIVTVSVPISVIFLVQAENKEKNDDAQTKIIFTSATSIVGGLVAWLLI